MTDRARRWRWALGTWIVLAAMSTLWAVATPIGGAPDEPAHMVKAASVVRGQLLEPNTEYGSIVQVPRYVAFTQAVTCFAFEPETTAACSPELTGDPSEIVPAYTTAGLYNPTYYLLVGWSTLIFSDVGGLYAMRIVSALLTSAFLAVAVAQLARERRPLFPVLAAAAAFTPMVIFLDGTVNPNALETAATFTVFTTMLAVVRRPDSSLLTARAAIIAVSASLAVNMRGISPLWVLIAIAAPFALVGIDRIRELFGSVPVRIAMAVVGAATAFALAWLVTSNSLGSGVDFAEGPLGAPGVGASPLGGFMMILFGTFNYAQGMVGTFGWLDTPAPPAVYFAWAAFLGMLSLLGTILPTGPVRRLGVALVAGVVFLPPLIQAGYIAQGGLIWQGRYALPLFVCMVAVLGVALADALPVLAPRVGRPLTLIALAIWATCQGYSFLTALRRYAVGLTGGLGEFITDPEWQPPLGIVPMLVLFALVAAAGAIVAIIDVGWGRRPSPAPQLATIT